MSFKYTEIEKIPVEWEVKMIQEIGEVVSGGTPKTKEDSYWDGNISWITPKDLSNFTERYIEVGERSITELGLKNSSAKLLPKGTVLFSSRAPIGYLAIARKELCTNQGFKNIVCDKKYSSNEFLFYMLKAKKNEIESIAGGSTFKEVSGKVVKEFKIPIPPLNEQKAIAHILSTLDDKIEVNNQINKTLENMAQAIFKQWFVDFEFPNEDGEPYKSSGGEMVESELGIIPMGWEVVELETIINVKHGYAFKSDYFSDDPTNKVLLTPGNFRIGGGFKDDKLKYYDETVPYPSDYVLNEGDILITMTDLSKTGDTLGYPIMLPRRKYTMLHNQRLGKVEIKNISIPEEYLYYLFCTREYRGYILGSATGTTVKHTAPKRIMAYKVALPNYNVLSAYSNAVSNIMKLLSDISYQNGVLLDIRNTLLPKLMSGKIRVPLDSEGDVS